MSSEEILITVITSTMNCADSLEKTAKSIQMQTNRKIQWIVADGGSIDNTLNVIIANTGLITDWFSAPDSGIYDAWNKASKLIRGEWVIFLGAGDSFCNVSVLEQAEAKLSNSKLKNTYICYGNVYLKDETNILSSGEVCLNHWDIYRPKLPLHQGVFHRSILFLNQKPFDDTYQIVADSKFLLLAKSKADFYYLNIDVSEMEPGGVSANPKHAVNVMKEFLRLEKDLEYKLPRFNKMRYIISCYAKSFLYKGIGTKLTNKIILLKRWLSDLNG